MKSYLPAHILHTYIILLKRCSKRNRRVLHGRDLSCLGRCPELDVLFRAVGKHVLGAPFCGCVGCYADGRVWLVSTIKMIPGWYAWGLAACPWSALCATPQTLVRRLLGLWMGGWGMRMGGWGWGCMG